MISPQLTVLCQRKKSAPDKMIRGSATADNQFAYFAVGDFPILYRYEWQSEKWEKLANTKFRNCGLVIIDSELTAVGGDRCRQLFTLQEGQWVEHYPPMNTERSSPAVVSTSDGNYIIVIGESDNWTTAVELFHVKTREWYELANLPPPLYLPSATICGNQLHIIGLDGDGASCSLQGLPSSEPIISQKISNILTWTPLPQLPVIWSTAATICGQLVTVGGEQKNQDGKSQIQDSIHQLIDGEWVKIGSIYSRRERCLVVNPSPDTMMIVGGYKAGHITGKSEGVEVCVVTY